MAFDDNDVREPPEAPAKCYECGRLSVNTDRCVFCGSPLMYSEDTIVTIAANRAHRPRPNAKKRKR